MEEKIKIIDDSGDKRFFTILPNYIANHSTANEQALYFQMKRMAGDDGLCFATQQTLMNKLKVRRGTLKKSLKYLIEKKWIEYVGMTGGKTRPIKTYKIIDIWQINNEFYTQNQKIPSQTALSIKKDTVPNSTKIPSQTAIEEEPLEEELTTTNVVVENSPPPKQDYKIIDNFLKEIQNILSLSNWADTIRWTRVYAQKCLKEAGRERTLEAVKWMKLNWNSKPTKMKTIFYGIREYEVRQESNKSQSITLKDLQTKKY